MSWKQLRVLGLILCYLGFLGCSEDAADDGMTAGKPEAPGDVNSGDDDASLPLAPNFTLLDTALEEVSLTDYRGKAVLVDFWATWCPPCREEMPIFVELYNQYREQGFEILGVSLDDEGLEVIEPFIKEIGVNYTILLGQPGLVDQYGVFTMPTAFLIDRNGRIVKKFDGAQGKKEIYESELKKLL
jgi:peroxiredoxin